MRRVKYGYGLGVVLAALIATGSVFAEQHAAQPLIGLHTYDTTPEPVLPTDEPTATEAPTLTAEPPVPTETAIPTPTAASVLPTMTAVPTAPSAPQPTPTRVTTPTQPTLGPTVITINGGPPTQRSVPLPGAVVAEVPLSLAQRASVHSAYVGMEVEYTVQILGSQVGTTVEVHSFLPAELDVISVAPSSGQCSGGAQPICHLTLGPDGMLIVIRTRVSDRAKVGTILTAQAAAQDSTDFTAASDMVNLAIVASPSMLVASQSSAQNPAPAGEAAVEQDQVQAAAQSEEVSVASTDARAIRAAGVSIDSQVVVMPSDRGGEVAPAAQPERVPGAEEAPLSVLAAQAGLPSTDLPDQGADVGMPLAEGSGSQPRDGTMAGAQYAAPLLPNTATGTVLGAWLIGMLGFAFAASGLRRVRRAALGLDDRRIEQLLPLVRAVKRAMRSSRE